MPRRGADHQQPCPDAPRTQVERLQREGEGRAKGSQHGHPRYALEHRVSAELEQLMSLRLPFGAEGLGFNFKIGWPACI